MAKSFAEVYGGQDSGPNNKVGTFESMLAGVGSGLIAIPKGLFSLGATLLDLGVDSGKAAEVEKAGGKDKDSLEIIADVVSKGGGDGFYQVDKEVIKVTNGVPKKQW